MKDKFFHQSNCDRCGNSLSSGRILSWFTTEIICTEKCMKEEQELKSKLPRNINYEGIGYIPQIK